MTQATRIEWTEALHTGESIIDAQHQYLVELINDVADILNTGQAEQKLGSTLPLLEYFCEWHFEREELCMHERQCPHAAANKHAHAAFLNVFAQFKAEYHAQGPSQELGLRMYTTLTDWLVNHIQKIDKTIAYCPAVHTS